jgi:hypothetical protein
MRRSEKSGTFVLIARTLRCAHAWEAELWQPHMVVKLLMTAET